MGPFGPRALLVALLFATLATCPVHAKPRRREAVVDEPEESALLEELTELQEKSPDGVIRFDVARFNRYATGRRRPYTLVIFLTAHHLLDKPSLGLRQLRKEYGFVAKAVRTAGSAGGQGRVYLADVEFRDSQEVFHRLGAKSLPWILRLLPQAVVEGDGAIKLRHDDVMRHEDYGHGHWTADDLSAFLADRTGLRLDKIERPSFARSPAFPFLVLAGLCGAGAAGWRLYRAPFMRSLALWTLGVLFVYWFSVSGGMHNIIRGVPLVYANREGVVQLFMPGSQGQLGAEGFITGTLYLLFALSLSALTYVAPAVKEPMARRVLGYLLLGVAYLSFRQVVMNYTWKSGYRWRTYFFR